AGRASCRLIAAPCQFLRHHLPFDVATTPVPQNETSPCRKGLLTKPVERMSTCSKPPSSPSRTRTYNKPVNRRVVAPLGKAQNAQHSPRVYSNLASLQAQSYGCKRYREIPVFRRAARRESGTNR